MLGHPNTRVLCSDHIAAKITATQKVSNNEGFLKQYLLVSTFFLLPTDAGIYGCLFCPAPHRQRIIGAELVSLLSAFFFPPVRTVKYREEIFLFSSLAA